VFVDEAALLSPDDPLGALLEVGTGVHAETAGTTAEAVPLGAVFAGVAVLAEQLGFVFRAVGRVQHLAAHSALEAGLVPFVAAGHALFGGVDRLLALGAFGVFDRLERHLDLVDLVGIGVVGGEVLDGVLTQVRKSSTDNSEFRHRTRIYP
jgi:hypothetical protein